MHSFAVRVYYEDTDAGGVVYHANYLKFAERARTEALRQAGIEQSELLAREKIAFAVRSCTLEFLKPARLDDLLTIDSHLNDIGTASLEINQIIKRGDTTLVTLVVKLAVIGENIKPVRLPPDLRDTLAAIFNNQEGKKQE